MSCLMKPLIVNLDPFFNVLLIHSLLVRHKDGLFNVNHFIIDIVRVDLMYSSMSSVKHLPSKAYTEEYCDRLFRDQFFL